MRSLWVLAVLGAALVPAIAMAENQCVACHELERLPISLGHSFDDWRYSAHGRAGITCDACHGGDPAAANADAAHRGALPASNPESSVHHTRLSGTCGSCHAEQYHAYEKTVHARQLASVGRGATCMTCHGAMATSLPSPAELEARCAVCHEKPLEASVALTMLGATKLRLRRTHRKIEGLRDVDEAWRRSLLDRFQDLEGSYHRIQLEWHTFDTTRVVRDSRDVLGIAKLLGEEAGRRAEMDEHEAGADSPPGK